MPTTPIGAAPYPAGTSADNVPADLEALAVWASTRVNMRFADAAARDAAITSPVAGMIAWLDTPGSVTVRTASAWTTLWSQIAWTDITLASGHTNYGTLPQATLDGGNFIVLKGGIQRSTEGLSVVTGSIVGTIPSSFGVPVSGDFPIATQYLSQSSARLYVNSDRNLTYVGVNTGWISLNGVRVPLS